MLKRKTSAKSSKQQFKRTKQNQERVNSKTIIQLSYKQLFFKFDKTKKPTVINISTKEDFVSKLSKIARKCNKTQDNWSFNPNSSWIKTLYNELPTSTKLRLKSKIKEEKEKPIRIAWTAKPSLLNAQKNWENGRFISTLIVDAWFEKKELVDVIRKAKLFGHIDFPQGLIFEGNFIEKNLSYAESLNTVTLKEKLKYFYSDRELNLYKLSHENPFTTVPLSYVKKVEDVHEFPFVGSLNTVHGFKDKYPLSKPTKEVKQYHKALTNAFKVSRNEHQKNKRNLELNQDFYFIWKFMNYATAYHQDQHTFPHLVLYNQTSGVSTFHFLPLLIGLFVTFNGRKDPERIHNMLTTLDKEGFGSKIDLKEGQVLCIMPCGAHGVWVPSWKNNKHVNKFTVSAIRAAEIFVKDLKKHFVSKLRHKEYDYLKQLDT